MRSIVVSVRQDLCSHVTYSLSYFRQGASREYRVLHGHLGLAEGQWYSSSRKQFPRVEGQEKGLPRTERPGF
jgi:hypothetical protein